ncbi:MAG: hypothetical protein IKL89_01060 [Clostridia bacterium]|nr:hypothetical protein [Clostridia bacterium]
MDDHMMDPTISTEPAEELQTEPEAASAPSESSAMGECVQDGEPASAPVPEDAETEEQTSSGELEALAREVLQLLRREQKAERSIGGESAAGSAGAGLTQRERANLADWNRRWPELAMTPGEWKQKGM